MNINGNTLSSDDGVGGSFPGTGGEELLLYAGDGGAGDTGVAPVAGVGARIESIAGDGGSTSNGTNGSAAGDGGANTLQSGGGGNVLSGSGAAEAGDAGDVNITASNGGYSIIGGSRCSRGYKPIRWRETK